jgi:hypothetical protein
LYRQSEHSASKNLGYAHEPVAGQLLTLFYRRDKKQKMNQIIQG